MATTPQTTSKAPAPPPCKRASVGDGISGENTPVDAQEKPVSFATLTDMLEAHAKTVSTNITTSVNASISDLLTTYDAAATAKFNEVHGKLADLASSAEAQNQKSLALEARLSAVEKRLSIAEDPKAGPALVLDELDDNRDPILHILRINCKERICVIFILILWPI